MLVKIDTKEKFTVLLLQDSIIYDNMAAELAATCKEYLTATVKNIILNFKNVSEVDDNAAKTIAELQQFFYEKNTSLVICELQLAVENNFEKLDLLELMNITPSESEAWDIVQMEEIERELLDNDDFNFSTNS